VRERSNLVEEYRANVVLLQHDDNLRQQRAATFLAVNTVLIVAVAALIGSGSSEQAVAGAVIPLSVLGLATSYIWERIQARNAEYVRFRRAQLSALEARLEGMTTFTRIEAAFYQRLPVELQPAQTFTLARRARHSSTRVEGLFPLALILFWALVLVAAIVISAVLEL
jgi:hypothetical protein